MCNCGNSTGTTYWSRYNGVSPNMNSFGGIPNVLQNNSTFLFQIDQQIAALEQQRQQLEWNMTTGCGAAGGGGTTSNMGMMEMMMMFLSLILPLISDQNKVDDTDDIDDIDDPNDSDDSDDPEIEMNAAKAAQILSDNFDIIDTRNGTMDKNEAGCLDALKDVVASTDDAELKAAAQWFIDNPDAYDEMEDISTEEGKDWFEKSDLEAFIAKETGEDDDADDDSDDDSDDLPPAEDNVADMNKFLATMEKNRKVLLDADGAGNGWINMSDINAILADESIKESNPDLYKAAENIKNNPALLELIDWTMGNGGSNNAINGSNAKLAKKVYQKGEEINEAINWLQDNFSLVDRNSDGRISAVELGILATNEATEDIGRLLLRDYNVSGNHETNLAQTLSNASNDGGSGYRITREGLQKFEDSINIDIIW